MRRPVIHAALVVTLGLSAGGCAPETVRAHFPVTFTARGDEPLAGVEVSIAGKQRLGATGPDGVLRVTLSGKEGTAVPFRVTCPSGHRAPREMPALTLRRFTGLDPAIAARGIEVAIECPPAERMAALVLKAGRPGLPVLAQGREVARTDEQGVAHALVAMQPNTTFRVVVDTRGDPTLRPQNPATTLALADSDEIFLIEHDFAIDKPAPVERRPRRRHRHRELEVPLVESRPTGPVELKGPQELK